MGRQKTSTYSIFLTVKADYADTSYWTTDGHPAGALTSRGGLSKK